MELSKPVCHSSQSVIVTTVFFTFTYYRYTWASIITAIIVWISSGWLGVSQETIKEIFALEKEQQKRQKKEIARENRKRKYGSRTRQKQSDKPVDPLLTSSHTHLSANGAADSGIVDDFETMEEPDIEIGVS